MRAHIADLSGLVSTRLSEIAAEKEPEALYGPVRYVLAGQGKRLRPVMLLLCAEMYGVQSSQAMAAALAIEIAHNWTLVHDDIMDRADTRRGRPTVHVKWDANMALLCGDLLLAMAYEQLSGTEPRTLPNVLAPFSRAAAALCEGQALDMQFERRCDVTTSEYLDMVDRKTGALMGAAMEIGAALGEAVPAERYAANQAGVAVGRAFQIMDDLLDLVAEDGRWGKVIGGDLLEGKRTFLLLEALRRSRGADRRFFSRIQQDCGLPAAEIPDARYRMERLGVLRCARGEVRRYTRRALAHLDALPGNTGSLAVIIQDMAARIH